MVQLSCSQNTLKINPWLKTSICHPSKHQTVTKGNLPELRASVDSCQCLALSVPSTSFSPQSVTLVAEAQLPSVHFVKYTSCIHNGVCSKSPPLLIHLVYMTLFFLFFLSLIVHCRSRLVWSVFINK